MSISSIRWRAASALITAGAAAAAVLALAVPAGAAAGTAEISPEQAGYTARPGPGAGADHRRLLRPAVLCRFTAFVAADTRQVTDGGMPHRVTQPAEFPLRMRPGHVRPFPAPAHPMPTQPATPPSAASPATPPSVAEARCPRACRTTDLHGCRLLDDHRSRRRSG
jgi:hypothetical protein